VKQIELSAGTIEYSDTGGDRPVLVLLHGLMMDASLWDGPMADLSADHRCVAPTLPLGAHRHAMRADADLSLPGIARLIAEFVDRLDLQDVTLVGNDTGGRSSSCSCATVTHVWNGLCSPHATHSTTSRPG
jgi:pimeloyl-ACP methyl ester carboxylesterase